MISEALDGLKTVSEELKSLSAGVSALSVILSAPSVKAKSLSVILKRPKELKLEGFMKQQIGETILSIEATIGILKYA